MPARPPYGFYDNFVRLVAATTAPLITIILFTGAAGL